MPATVTTPGSWKLHLPRLAAAGLMACLSGGSIVQQTPAIPFTIDPETPPGSLIDIGTHRLHIHCMGTGSPTVIMEFGLGGHSLEWAFVQSELARHQRACAYDRAGYGWSDRGPLPRLSSTIARELNRLLDRAGLEPPFILVGHSFGGFNIRQLQQLRGREVAGMVLIESSHEAQFERLESEAGVSVTPSGNTFTLKYVPRERNLPPVVGNVVRKAQLTRKTYATVRDEMASMLRSAEAMRSIEPLGDTPLVVLTREPANPDERNDQFEEIWQNLQRRLTRLSSRSRQVIAHDSGHDVHVDEPELVVDAVRSLSTYNDTADRNE